ncbi:MAG: sigma-54 dependent transcriptional regulator [Candidatus Eisenbacteria bacterium]|uniref:Sigma-54 dependent transcriptional regulator n=1 Tax=Eiseniibacteriota bacterium TaxID=2212470 RepID=A0A948RTU1_UNCEI|nr:sigma-54 dependent transcriptional regulator [Candidatus Eisenbacteria bacterium]
MNVSYKTPAETTSRILIIDDEAPIRQTIATLLEMDGHEVIHAENLAVGRRSLTESSPDILFLDVWLPDGHGVEFLPWIRRRFPALPILMISGQADIAMAVKAIHEGAMDFLEKPLSAERVLVAVRNAQRFRSLENENLRLREAAGLGGPFIYESAAMEKTLEEITRAARTETPVLLTGESGTGKERLAHFLHEHSPRKEGPFVAVNAAAIPQDLLESELFGHEKGAFTGAMTRRIGRFQSAHGGTLFLDEIGDMPESLQAKLLRVLESGMVEPLGGTAAVPVNVRFLSATHRDLAHEVESGRFRLDLYHRLAVLVIRIPPLRERQEDILALTRHYISQFTVLHGLGRHTLTSEAEAALLSYSWPGNVRELRNLIERIFILEADGPVDRAAVERLQAQNPMIEPENSSLLVRKSAAMAGPFSDSRPEESPTAAQTYKEHFALWEKQLLQNILDAESWNVARAAARLGLDRSHLHRKIRQYDIIRPH